MSNPFALCIPKECISELKCLDCPFNCEKRPFMIHREFLEMLLKIMKNKEKKQNEDLYNSREKL